MHNICICLACVCLFSICVKEHGIVTDQRVMWVVMSSAALRSVLVADAVREVGGLLHGDHAGRIRRPPVQSCHHLQVFQFLLRIFTLRYRWNVTSLRLDHIRLIYSVNLFTIIVITIWIICNLEFKCDKIEGLCHELIRSRIWIHYNTLSMFDSSR